MPWSPLDYVETRIKVETDGFEEGGFDSEYCHFMTDKGNEDGDDDESSGSDSVQELDQPPLQPNVTKTASVPTEKTITPLAPYVPPQQQQLQQQPQQQQIPPTVLPTNPPPIPSANFTASTYQCKYCNLVCQTFEALHEHLITGHQVKLNCNRTKCKKTFNSTEALARHIKKHDEDRARKQEAKERRKVIELTCKICGKMCTTNYKFRLHMIQHSGNLPFPCALCDKAFLEKCRLAHHMLVNHPDPNVPKPHGCKFCGKRFTDKSYLKVHERSHTKEKPYICEQCGKAFPCRNSLKRHRDCHSEVKKYRCEVCGKMFKFITTLSTHRYRKHKNPRQKTEVCKQCGAAFTTRYLLRVHYKTHKINIPLACDFCGKNFINRKRMATHMKTHLNIRAHVCEICGRDFIGSSTLKQHMLTHTGARPHECHVCHQRFAQITALKTHFKRHPNILPFKCQLCGQSFRLKSEFNTHSESHGNEPIVENLSNSTNQSTQNTFPLAPPCPTFQMSKLQTEFNLQYGHTAHPHNPLPPALPTMTQDIQQPNWYYM